MDSFLRCSGVVLPVVDNASNWRVFSVMASVLAYARSWVGPAWPRAGFDM